MSNCFKVYLHERFIAVFGTEALAWQYVAMRSYHDITLPQSQFHVVPAFIDGIGF
jgi:hypothetical protein